MANEVLLWLGKKDNTTKLLLPTLKERNNFDSLIATINSLMMTKTDDDGDGCPKRYKDSFMVANVP